SCQTMRRGWAGTSRALGMNRNPWPRDGMLATSERCSHGGGTSPSTDDTNVFDLGQRLARTVVRLSALPRTPAGVATLRDAQRYKLLLADDAAADARRIRLAVSEFLRRAEEVVA